MIATPDSFRPTDGRPCSVVDMTDEDLLLGFRSSRDQDLFAELVRRYERELYSYVCRILGDSTMAEDVFQGTFLQLYNSCDRFEKGRRLRPWLYAIATNQAIDAMRRNRRHRLISLDQCVSGEHREEGYSLAETVADDQPDPRVHLECEERRRWVRTAIERLPEQMKTAVNLVVFQGFKYREVAEVLSVPVGTVKSRMHTAIRKLREDWKSCCPAEV